MHRFTHRRPNASQWSPDRLSGNLGHGRPRALHLSAGDPNGLLESRPELHMELATAAPRRAELAAVAGATPAALSRSAAVRFSIGASVRTRNRASRW